MSRCCVYLDIIIFDLFELLLFVLHVKKGMYNKNNNNKGVCVLVFFFYFMLLNYKK